MLLYLPKSKKIYWMDIRRWIMRLLFEHLLLSGSWHFSFIFQKALSRSRLFFMTVLLVDRLNHLKFFSIENINYCNLCDLLLMKYLNLWFCYHSWDSENLWRTVQILTYLSMRVEFCDCRKPFAIRNQHRQSWDLRTIQH